MQPATNVPNNVEPIRHHGADDRESGLGASRDAVLEHVSCAVCGSNDCEVVLEAQDENEKDVDLIQKFRASGDELLIDRLVKCRGCGLQYISPRLRGDLDLLELCGGRGSGLRLPDGRQGAYIRDLSGTHREARRTARDTSRHRDSGRGFSCCGDQARLEGRRVRAESLARRVGLETLRRPHPLRAASSSSPTNHRASTSSRSGTSSSTRRIRAR